MKKLKEFLFLSDKGYKDLKKAIVACTITNLALMLPFCVTVMLFNELLNPYVGRGDNNVTLGKSLEDYLETILILKIKKGMVRSIDVAD